jgi:hypothetical protein
MDHLEVLESKQRHQAMLDWREQERLYARLPKQESAIKALSRQVVAALISRVSSINDAPVPAQPRASEIRREA